MTATPRIARRMISGLLHGTICWTRMTWGFSTEVPEGFEDDLMA